MKATEELRILENACRLTNGTPSNIATIFNAYRMFVNNNATLCADCPQSVRITFKRLKEYYSANKDKLQKQAKIEAQAISEIKPNKITKEKK